MTAWSNNFNAIASGTAITTSNSGTSGTAFSLVQTGTGTSVIAQATSAFEGATGMAIVTAAGVNADVIWSISGAGQGVRLSQSFWFKRGTLPASELGIVSNSSGAVRLSTTGQVLVYTSAGTLLATATAAAADTWLYIQHATTSAASTTTGRIECVVTTAAGATLLTYDSGTTVNANTAAVTSHTYGAPVGSTSTIPSGTSSYDLLNLSNVLSSGFPGATAPIPTYAPGQFLPFF